jgi:hypothetical protein
VWPDLGKFRRLGKNGIPDLSSKFLSLFVKFRYNNLNRFKIILRYWVIFWIFHQNISSRRWFFLKYKHHQGATWTKLEHSAPTYSKFVFEFVTLPSKCTKDTSIRMYRYLCTWHVALETNLKQRNGFITNCPKTCGACSGGNFLNGFLCLNLGTMIKCRPMICRPAICCPAICCLYECRPAICCPIICRPRQNVTCRL